MDDIPILEFDTYKDFEIYEKFDTFETTQVLSNDDITTLLVRQLENQVEITKISIILFAVMLSAFCMIMFLKSVFQNA